MTLLTRNSHVQAEKWKFRQVVVEVCYRFPTLRNVALLTPDSEPGPVHIARPMTTAAVRRKFLTTERSRVTGVAVQLGVLSNELPVSVARVIECGRLPLLVAVTLGAVASEAPGMSILTLVAPGACLRHRIFQVSGTMAVLAVQVHVRALQGKPGLLRMIEAGRFP